MEKDVLPEKTGTRKKKAELLNFQCACPSLRHCVNFFEHRGEHSCYDEIKEGWLHP